MSKKEQIKKIIEDEVLVKLDFEREIEREVLDAAAEAIVALFGEPQVNALDQTTPSVPPPPKP